MDAFVGSVGLKLRANSMLANFLRAGFGGAASQLINFLAVPIIARLYAPEDYATWALIVAAGTILGSVASLRFELAIVLPKDPRNASSVFWGSVVIACLTVSIMCTASYLIMNSDWAIRTLGFERNPSMLIGVGVFALSFAVYQSFRYWNIRLQRYTLNSLAQIIFAVITLATQAIWAIFYRSTAIGLLLGTFAGQLSALAVLVIGAIAGNAMPFIDYEILRQSPTQLKDNRKFFLYSTPYTLFGVLRDRAVLFVLEVFTSSTQVGFYAFVFRIMNFPVTLVSNSLRPVLFQESAARGVKAIEQHVYQILRFLIVISAPFVVIYFLYAEQLFYWLFGEQWIGASHIGKFIIFPIYTFLFVNWMDRLMDVLGEQRITLILEVIFAVGSIAGLLIGFGAEWGLNGALALQAIVLVAYNVTYLLVAYSRAGFRKIQLLKIGLYGVCSALATFIIAILLRGWILQG